jgi:ATP-dependent RNA helicase RhlE
MTFKDLNLIPSILDALEDENYTEPTAIQAKAIPVALKGTDILASAQTGTGKTAAFAIPILQHLSENNHHSQGKRKITTLVVTPTRELAIQISESFTTYGRYTNIKNTVIFGGVNQTPQKEALRRGVDVLVATPGRLLDLMGQGFVSLNDIRYFVLDEADRMLDMGFIPDVKRIIAKLPKKRQSLFFSATMPQNIVELSRQILFRPEKIAVDPVSSTAETIKQYLYMTNKDLKKDLLYHILDDKNIDQVLLFSRTKHGADRIAKILKKKHITCGAIHGDKSQNQRQKALNSFKNGELRVLVATDIAARGIDIDKLQYVINYDIPNEAETYVHRIGRCGRAGEDGIAISMCEPEENVYIKAIEKLTKQRIERIQDHPYPQTDKPMNAEERKEFEKEKQRKKQEFFAARKRNNSARTGKPGRR